MTDCTAKELLSKFPIQEKMAQSNAIEEHFCLDDYDSEEVTTAIVELNRLYPAYHFERREKYGGFAHDLVMTNIARKKEYDRLPKPHTYGELFHILKEDYGIFTSTAFHYAPTDRLTEQEFQQILMFYKNFDVDELFELDEEE